MRSKAGYFVGRRWRIRRPALIAVGVVCFVAFPPVLLASAYIPAGRDVVLWRLSSSSLLEKSSDADRRRARDEAGAVVQLATDLIRFGRRTGDARAFGQAEALLRPWLMKDPVAVPLRLLWADVLQHRHDFVAALAQLDEVLRVDPGNVQALLMRVAIRVGRGERAAAATDCRRLWRRTTAMIVAVCAGQSAMNQARIPSLINALDRSIADEPAADPDIQAWAWQVLAELYARLGEKAGVDRAFRAALNLTPDAVPLIVAYADWLLSQGRGPEALELITGYKAYRENDALLLRAALAQRTTTGSSPHENTLRERFAQIHRRGDTAPSLDYARYLLDLVQDVDAALSVALENWEGQKEPDAAKLVMRAAALARQPEKARTARAWLEENGYAESLTQAVNDNRVRRGE